jgi:hypothetical protein
MLPDLLSLAIFVPVIVLFELVKNQVLMVSMKSQIFLIVDPLQLPDNISIAIAITFILCWLLAGMLTVIFDTSHIAKIMLVKVISKGLILVGRSQQSD